MSDSKPNLIRVAILDDYQSVALSTADWSSIKSRLSIDVFTSPLLQAQSSTSPKPSEEFLIKQLLPYTIICTMRERTPFPRTLLSSLPNLKLLTTTGPKNASIDLSAAQEHGITVCGTGGGGASTLEHIWALILAVMRGVVRDHQSVVQGYEKWQVGVPVGLWGKTLGVVGVGRLGSQTAKIAKAFNMRVIGWSPNLTPERAEQAGVEFCATKEDLLRTADVVSIHMVLSPSTVNLIDAASFALMKPTAFLINTSRGPIVNEDALVDALERGVIRGAGLDVFDVEPLPFDHRLRRMGNVVLTPHVGYVADTMYEVFWRETVENIKAFLDGKPVRVM